MRSFEVESRGVVSCAVLAVAEAGRLTIGARAGSVNVRAGRPGFVEVTLRSPGPLPAPALEVGREGDDVFVEALAGPIARWLAPWASRGVELEVSVPARYSVDVETRTGRVEVHGVDGEVDARSEGGHLRFCNVRGPIDGRTRRGSIDVSDCRGDVDVATARGTIEIQNVEGQVSAHTRGGSFQIESARGSVLAFA